MVNQAQTGEMKIAVVSQELFTEAIRTLPLSPEHVELTMLANGIVPEYKEDRREEYVAKCLEQDIIPFSGITFEYNEKENLFVPTEQKIVSCEESTTRKAVEGGKFNKLDIKTWIRSPSQSFEDFKKEGGFLDLLLENGYQFYYGDIWLNHMHFRGYNAGDSKDGGLVLSAGYIGIKGLELELWSEIDSGDEKKLVNWFSELKDKYQHKQGKLIS